MERNTDSVRNAVKLIIANRLKIPVIHIDDDAQIMEHLGADSLDALVITAGIENHFGIQVPDGTAQDARTVSMIVEKLLTSFNQANESGSNRKQ